MTRWEEEEAYLTDLVLVHAAGNVVLVLEDQQGGSHEALDEWSMRGKRREEGMAYFLHEQTLQLHPAVVQTLAVGGIDDPDEGVGLLEVALPVRAKGLLAADVPCKRSAWKPTRWWHVDDRQIFSLYLHLLQYKRSQASTCPLLTRRSQSS